MTQVTQTDAGASGRYINFTASVLNNAIKTVLVYCKPTGAPENNLGYVFCKCDSAGTNGERLFVNHNSGNPVVTYGASSSGVATQPFQPGADNCVVYNSWGHYAASWTGGVLTSGIKVYAGVGVDLALTVGSTLNDGSGSALSDAANAAYLMNRPGLVRAFIGDLAYVAAWDHVLTLTELKNAQNNGPLAQSSGLLLLYANGQDYGPNALTITARSTYVAGGSQPPNTALGSGSGADALAGASADVATATGTLTDVDPLGGAAVDTVTSAATLSHSGALAGAALDVATGNAGLTHDVPLSGAATDTATAAAIFPLAIDAGYERSSVNVASSGIVGAGDSAVISIFPRPIASEVTSGVAVWLEPGARIVGVNGYRPTFRFLSYLTSGAGEIWGSTWQSTRRPMFSYDRVTWHYFDTDVTVDTTNHWIEFRNSTAFTADVVYISRGRQVSVTQVGTWIAGLAASYAFVSPTPSAVAFAPVNCTGFPAQDYIADEFSGQTTELGATVTPTPFYGFWINDTSLMPADGIKKLAVVMCGVHAGEDLHAWPHNAFIEYICGGSAAAQTLRRDFKILCYPMMNAPGRYGGHWRGSFQTVSGTDDLNRHFGDTTTLEIVSKPRTALLADLASATPAWQLDFHGDWGISPLPNAGYWTTSQRNAFRTAWEAYQGSTYDEGALPAGCTAEYFRTNLSCPYSIGLEFNDAVPITDAALTAAGQNIAKALADMANAGTWGFTATIAGTTADVADATGALTQLVPIAGAAVTVATATGAMSLSLPIAGAASAIAAAAGGLSLSIPVAATAVAQALVQAGLTQVVPLGGDSGAQAGATADLAHGVPLGGDGAALAAAAAEISLNITLAGSPIANAAAAAGLTVTGAASMAADAQAVAGGSGALTLAVPVAGAALTITGAAGGLTQIVPLTGSAASASLGTGGLDIRVDLSGAALVNALAAADLTTAAESIELGGDAAAVAAGLGTLTLRINLSADAIANAVAGGALTDAGLLTAATPGFAIDRAPRTWRIAS